MIKTVALITRRPDISREEFVKHYEAVHAPPGSKTFKTVKKYIRNHVVEMPGVEGPPFDCISEFWFDSLDDAVKIMEFVQSDAGKVFRNDELTFMDTGKTISFLV